MGTAGKLNSTPNETFKAQFFSSPRGTSQSKSFLGETSVSAEASGNGLFTFKPAQKVKKRQFVTATASGDEDTSEFSIPTKVTRA